MKFNSPLAEHLYGLSMESFEDDTAGGNPHTWYALFIEERAILSEDPHGFVDAVTYESEAYAKSIWSKIQDSLVWRSEEHTSELQSIMRISYAVFCLKKKKH